MVLIKFSTADKKIHEIEFSTSNLPVSNIASTFDHIYGILDEIDELSD